MENRAKVRDDGSRERVAVSRGIMAVTVTELNL